MPYEKVGNKEPVCIADEIPFDIPDSWEWVRWGTLSESIQYGYNAPAQENGRIKMVRISDIQDNSVMWETVPYCDIKECEIDAYLLKPNDILFARTGGTVGKSYLVQEVPEEAIYAGYLIRTRYSDRLCPQYLKYFMESELYWSQLREGTIATAQPNCNGKTLGNMLVPLPPSHEQIRIVEKLNAVINHVIEYDTASSKSKHLNDIFPEQLKKSILQEAVQGKLVPQNPDEEPASVLLERIRAEKEQLIKAGKIKRDKHESIIFRRDNSHYEKRDSEEVCIDEELPFNLPDTWSWARLGDLCSVEIGRLDANAQTPDGEYAFFTCGREVFKTKTYAFDCDAILLGGNNASGDYKMHRYSGKFNAYQRVYVISGRETDFLNYLYYVITFWLGHLKKNSQGTTTRFIKLGQVTGMLVPVPPYVEQKRITQTIQLLLSKCDCLQ